MVEHSDIQGNILRGYTFPIARFLLISLGSAAAGRTWLAAVVDQVTTAEPWKQRPTSTFNLAFTYPGLERLGVEPAVLAAFPDTFREGMAHRARHLGDEGPNAPTEWENELGSPETVARGHALLSIYAETTADCDARLAAVLPRGAEISLIFTQEAALLDGGREHFGFRDGISNPALEGEAGPRNFGGGLRLQSDSSLTIAPGEFITGYPGQGGLIHRPPAAPFDKNATYIVYRKLHQSVAAFRSYVNETANRLRFDPEWLAARMVGRWKDGTPTVLSPDAPDPALANDPSRVNDFQFAQDPRGLKCPVGAHIRRTNPRDGLSGGGAAVEGHRMIRRGITYGESLPEGADDDGGERGLLFISCNVNLQQQFEFVQRLWLNDSGFTNTLDPDQYDPIVGNNDGVGTMTVPVPTFSRRLQELPNFVRLRYGAYFIVPGLRALRTLSQLV